MSEYTRKPRSSRHNKRAPRILLVLCLMLVVMVGSIAGTVAWLTATSENVTNTFTVGDINITLQEYAYDASTNTLDKNADTVTEIKDYKIYPGAVLPKEPFVTVTKGSEPCYVYACVTNNIQLSDGTNVATLTVGSNWTLVGQKGNKSVYKYNSTVDALSEAKNTSAVITTVSIATDSVTKENITQLKDKTIVVQAYAHQSNACGETTATAAAIAKFDVTAVTTTPSAE